MHWRGWAGVAVMLSGCALVALACTGSDPDPVGAGADSGVSGSSGTSGAGTSSGGGTSGTSGTNGDSGPSLDCKAPEVPCGSACVDTATNHDNCGTCGNACGATIQCFNGHCANEPTDLALGYEHTCVALAGGQLWCWGGNVNGALGVPRATVSSTSTPMLVSGISDVARVFVGTATTCAVKTDNTVYCWGGNKAGIAGHDPKYSDDEKDCSYNADFCNATPRQVLIPTGGPGAVVGLKADELIIGPTSVCARQLDGTVICWGHRACGYFGDGDAGQILGEYLSPRVVPGLEGIVHLARSTRSGHFCGRKEDGSVICWGDNTEGQCGTPPTSPPQCTDLYGSAIVTPTPVPDLSGVTDLAIGPQASCAVVGGDVECWGGNYDGIVDPTSATTTIPARTKVPVGGTATKVAVGDQHACALLADGSVVCWGRHAAGRIGDEEPVQDAGIVRPAPARSVHATSIVEGPDFSGALGLNRKVLLWGSNMSGKLAQPTSRSQSGLPVEVLGLP